MSVRLRDFSEHEFRLRLNGPGLGIRIGPFDVHMRANVKGLAGPLYSQYRDSFVLGADGVFSVHVAIEERFQVLPTPKRVVRFSVDGRAPHEDLPAEQALAVLEWGLNLVIALRYHTFLKLHAAVVERNGKALLLPALPGHGKTTLCSALVHRGWRLLSDEFGMLRPRRLEIIPIPRPMPLKNESIDVIRRFAPGAEFGPVIPNTRKGTVAHVKPPTSSIDRAGECASPGWILFPRWIEDAPLTLEEVGGAETFMMLATNAFNYEMLGESAYDTVRSLVDICRGYRLVYSDLDEAVSAIDALTRENDRSSTEVI